MGYINYPLLASILGILLAQGLKIPIDYVVSRKAKVGLAFSTGGMPSSHSAAVTSLATAVGIQEGFSSPVFAVATVFAMITMFDATGVRRQTGEHSIIINQLLDYVHSLHDKEFMLRDGNEKLKEMLGHKPIEVFFGGLLGIVIAYVLSLI